MKRTHRASLHVCNWIHVPLKTPEARNGIRYNTLCASAPKDNPLKEAPSERLCNLEVNVSGQATWGWSFPINERREKSPQSLSVSTGNTSWNMSLWNKSQKNTFHEAVLVDRAKEQGTLQNLQNPKNTYTDCTYYIYYT